MVVTDRFQLPWTAVAAAVASVFLVVFITMLYAMNRIKRENPLDALRNEIFDLRGAGNAEEIFCS